LTRRRCCFLFFLCSWLAHPACGREGQPLEPSTAMRCELVSEANNPPPRQN
jgi:hypothetical protein